MRKFILYKHKIIIQYIYTYIDKRKLMYHKIYSSSLTEIKLNCIFYFAKLNIENFV